jgi:hypothetical protein
MGGCGLRGRGLSGLLWCGFCKFRFAFVPLVFFVSLEGCCVLIVDCRATYFMSGEIKPETHTVPMVQLADHTIRTIDHSDPRIPGIGAKGS